jgi:hypothetical protein
VNKQENTELSALYNNMVASRFFKNDEPINNSQEIEKAIELLKRSTLLDTIYTTEEHDKALQLAISALEHQLTNGWIPVSERLPKQDEEVLVTDIIGKVRLMWIVGDRFEN